MRLHAVLAASAFALALLVARAVLTGRADFVFLAWNLFLALVPVALAWPSRDREPRRDAHDGSDPRATAPATTFEEAREAFQVPRTPEALRVLRRIARSARALAWWLFFPNSAYLVTDLVHLRPRAMPYWFDVGLFAAFALAGLAASTYSLERMRAHVPERLRVVFVLGVAASAGFAIWVGRFLRFNSWDALLAPWRTLVTIGEHAAHRPAQALGVTLLFGGLLLVAHAAIVRGRYESLDGRDRHDRHPWTHGA